MAVRPAGDVRPALHQRPASPWPRRLFLVAALAATPLALLVIAEYLLASDPRLPQLTSLDDYRPQQMTRLYSSTVGTGIGTGIGTGELIGEVVGDHRTRLPRAELPPLVVNAVVARFEPQLFDSAPLGQRALLDALYDFVRGRPSITPISLIVARSLVRTLPDPTWMKNAKAWIVAVRLEHALPRIALLRLFLDEVPFGVGVYGAEEAARLMFAKPCAKLDEKQSRALAKLAATQTALPIRSSVIADAAACTEEALARIGERYDEDALSRLGARVVTTCDPALTTVAKDAMKRAHVDKLELRAAAVVLRVPTHEVAALVNGGAADVTGAKATHRTHAIGALRVPLLLATALESHRWNAASIIGEAGQGVSLRAFALASPFHAVEALRAGGLSPPAVQTFAQKLGIVSPVSGPELLSGRAQVTPLEVATMLAALASHGEVRQRQLLRSISDVEEPKTQTIAALSPAASYLVGSLMPLPAVLRGRVKQAAAGILSVEVGDAWFAAYTPDRVVVVWVGSDGDPTKAKEGDTTKAAVAIGMDVLAGALRALPQMSFDRPPTLVRRSVTATGMLLPKDAPGGTEEWFIPGALPREAATLPPE